MSHETYPESDLNHINAPHPESEFGPCVAFTGTEFASRTVHFWRSLSCRATHTSSEPAPRALPEPPYIGLGFPEPRAMRDVHGMTKPPLALHGPAEGRWASKSYQGGGGIDTRGRPFGRRERGATRLVCSLTRCRPEGFGSGVTDVLRRMLRPAGRAGKIWDVGEHTRMISEFGVSDLAGVEVPAPWSCSRGELGPSEAGCMHRSYHACPSAAFERLDFPVNARLVFFSTGFGFARL